MTPKRTHDGVVRDEPAGGMLNITIQLSAGDLAALQSIDLRDMPSPHRRLYEAVQNEAILSAEAIEEDHRPQKRIKQEEAANICFKIQIEYSWCEISTDEEHFETLTFRVKDDDRIEDLFSRVEYHVPYKRYGSVSCFYKDEKLIYRPDIIDLEPESGNALKELGINESSVLYFGPADKVIFQDFEHDDPFLKLELQQSTIAWQRENPYTGKPIQDIGAEDERERADEVYAEVLRGSRWSHVWPYYDEESEIFAGGPRERAVWYQAYFGGQIDDNGEDTIPLPLMPLQYVPGPI